MGVYEVEGPGGTFEIESEQAPTSAVVLQALRAHGDAIAAKEQTRLEDKSHVFAAPTVENTKRFVSNLVEQLNPFSFVKAIGDAALAPAKDELSKAKAAYDAGNHDEAGQHVLAALPKLNPTDVMGRAVKAVIGGVVGGQVDQAKQAVQAAREGRTSEAVGHGAAAALPLLGPASAAAGEQMAEGDVAGGLGKAAGLLTQTSVLPRVAPKVVRAVEGRLQKPLLVNPNPVEGAAMDWVRQEGVPVDVGTATGNKMLRATREMADISPIGSIIENRSRAATAEGLEGLGRRLAGDIAPGAQTPETASEAVKAGAKQAIQTLHGQAGAEYDTFRKLAEAPDQVKVVPSRYRDTAGMTPEAFKRINEAAGGSVTTDTINELRRIRAELGANGFEEAHPIEGQDLWSPRVAGAPVYDDIAAHMPGLGKITRGEAQTAITRALETGRLSEAGQAALKVAEKRLDPTATDVSSPTLPPGAEAANRFEEMASPVDLRGVKSKLQGLYDSLVSGWSEQQKAASPGLPALRQIVEGPDFLPATDVEGQLSTIKAMLRDGRSVAGLKTRGQAVGLKAIGELEAQLRESLPAPAYDALQTGRSLTRAKWESGKVLSKLVAGDGVEVDPSKAYKLLTAPGDARAGLLREVGNMAPMELGKLGRAYFDGLLNTATDEGGFMHGAKISAEWNRLGPQTKRMLFGADRAADLDKFFLAVKRLGAIENPSGTAKTLAAGKMLSPVLWVGHMATGIPVMLGQGAVSAILHSTKATQVLTEGLRLAASPQRAAQVAAAGQVVRAASLAGVSMADLMPAAAKNQQDGADRAAADGPEGDGRR